MRIVTGYKQKRKSQMSIKEREAIKAWKSLQKLSAAEWIDRINKLPKRPQDQIKRMVWWDFGSNKTVSERWPEFDDCLQFDEREEVDPVPLTMIAKCLKAVGYPQYRIKLRLMAF